MPAAPENLVATVLEWEVSASPPNLCVQLTPGVPLPIPPEPLQALRFSLLFWPCLGGVPEMQENTVDEVAAQVDDAATDEEHVSLARKKRARRRRAEDSARKLRRSIRLKAKEEPDFEHPEGQRTRLLEFTANFQHGTVFFSLSRSSSRLRRRRNHQYC
ncbi:uncharacterized protein [Miscanthus floridulus]|uniref:uncharacterized protein n=1 Tax=Miscanthus floridulus TaxID=154761 RepID=UPI0034576B03